MPSSVYAKEVTARSSLGWFSSTVAASLVLIVLDSRLKIMFTGPSREAHDQEGGLELAATRRTGMSDPSAYHRRPAWTCSVHKPAWYVKCVTSRNICAMPAIAMKTSLRYVRLSREYWHTMRYHCIMKASLSAICLPNSSTAELLAKVRQRLKLSLDHSPSCHASGFSSTLPSLAEVSRHSQKISFFSKCTTLLDSNRSCNTHARLFSGDS